MKVLAHEIKTKQPVTIESLLLAVNLVTEFMFVFLFKGVL